MTIKQRIITFMQNHPEEGIDDDELARILSLNARQQANTQCRELEKEGLVIRQQVNGKIHNFWAGKDIATPPNSEKYQNRLPKDKLWYWEGNVQSKVINFLVMKGYQIHSEADTASHQHGIDIVAENDEKPLWVTVKGYPQRTDKTNPSLQASHWFKEAIFDIIEYREQDRNVSLVVALPDFPSYRSKVQKITWLKPVANFSYFWVNENGEVFVE